MSLTKQDSGHLVYGRLPKRLYCIELWDNISKQHGIEDWNLVFTNRSKVTAGRCIYHKKTIEVAHFLIKNNNKETIRQTLLQEIAHALLPGHGHDRLWKRKCAELGIKSHRCYDSNTMQGAIKREPKYKAICCNCSSVHTRAYVPKGSYLCNKEKSCRKYILEFKKKEAISKK